ncbi:MAG TPA: L-seryl-tRNA(Sec) selenium transferase [Actinomycetota bacterium]|jgi:L-seryl-tRNA(Ser) seleniumtransferase|nr:L-seryl-tRNA(Sec) selenium transferase [Actinomycetota bacterium]
MSASPPGPEERPEAAKALRSLPGVDRVLDALDDPSHTLAVEAARKAVGEARAALMRGEEAPSFGAVVERARGLLAEERRTLLSPVINATGVLAHTNLGRAPLGREQLDAVIAIASGYSNLELDLESGKRGSRYAHAGRLASKILGTESAVVVNNNAAAVLVVLAALCADKDVLISRGELIEIGGEFRIPEIMEASGARLVEVGTTNRTHLADYERAITPETVAILRVHPSNYRVVGFTASPSTRDLGRLARGRGLLLLYDLGSGLVHEPREPWAAEEPRAQEAVAAGCDVVTFSGDKLLGGPQAGIVAGRKELVDRVARHPLMRALRVDKMTLAALQETLLCYLDGRAASIPLWRMATAPAEWLEDRARRVAGEAERSCEDLKAEAVPSIAVAGGGSLPGAEIPSWAVAVRHQEMSAEELAARLRRLERPVIGRIEEGVLLLDLRTVAQEDDGYLAQAFASLP